MGNATRLELLLEAGADVNAVDLYRISSLHYAATYGHLEAVNVLLRWGAGDDMKDLESSKVGRDCGNAKNNVDSTPLRAAFANGHMDIYTLLKKEKNSRHHGYYDLTEAPPMTHFNDTAVQRQHQFERDMNVNTITTMNNIPKTSIVIPFNGNHVGAGSYCIDNAFCDGFIDKLVNLSDSLREEVVGKQQKQHQHQQQQQDGAGRNRDSRGRGDRSTTSRNNYHHQQQQNQPQSTNAARRSHYCDTEGWLCASLTAALQQHHQQQNQSTSLSSSSPPKHVLLTTFVSYPTSVKMPPRVSLAPHKDYSVLDRYTGRMSTHTFILYLTTVAKGGETVLLDHLPSVVGMKGTNNNDGTQNDKLP